MVSPQQAALVQQYEDRCAAEGLSFLPLTVYSYVVGKLEDEAVIQLRQRAAVLQVCDSVDQEPNVVPTEIDGDECYVPLKYISQ